MSNRPFAAVFLEISVDNNTTLMLLEFTTEKSLLIIQDSLAVMVLAISRADRYRIDVKK